MSTERAASKYRLILLVAVFVLGFLLSTALGGRYWITSADPAIKLDKWTGKAWFFYAGKWEELK